MEPVITDSTPSNSAFLGATYGLETGLRGIVAAFFAVMT